MWAAVSSKHKILQAIFRMSRHGFFSFLWFNVPIFLFFFFFISGLAVKQKEGRLHNEEIYSVCWEEKSVLCYVQQDLLHANILDYIICQKPLNSYYFWKEINFQLRTVNIILETKLLLLLLLWYCLHYFIVPCAFYWCLKSGMLIGIR